MGFERDRTNYPELWTEAFTDPRTRAEYLDAVWVIYRMTINSRQKRIDFEYDVYANAEAFEAGGEPIDTPIGRHITMDTTPTYDEVIMTNGHLVGGILVVLGTLNAEMTKAERESK